MTKEESLYQVKLIIDELPEDEYELIPKEMIKYIEENMQINEKITINPEIPLEEQNIDDRTYNYLEKIVNEIEKNIKKSNNDEEKEKLLNLIEKYKIENQKITKAKDLITEYQELIKNKDNEINNLKSTNQELYNSISKCPFLIRKIFFKNFDKKLLKQ